jgi:endoglucanase
VRTGRRRQRLGLVAALVALVANHLGAASAGLSPAVPPAGQSAVAPPAVPPPAVPPPATPPPAVVPPTVPPPVPAPPATIAVEAEAGLVGQNVTIRSSAGASGGSDVHFSGPAQPVATTGVRVAGNRLVRDGAAFAPVGFTMVAAVNPTGSGETAAAASRFNDSVIQAAVAWGADTLRFQVSQRGLDPTDPLYSDAYVGRVLDAVAMARAHGLVVILSIQDQGPSGGSSHAQPSDATIRDWQTLTARFNGDQNVIYEIFNEPQNRATPDGWSVWRNGGPPARNQGAPAVGHQAVLDAIRATGATNVVVADAGQFGQLLTGIPLLHDPIGQVAYGVHPYLTNTLRDPSGWEPGFGFLSTQFPVVATEWTANSKVVFCHPEWATTAPQLLDYLQARGIGILGWAFDVLDSLVLDWSYTPTSLDGFQCGQFDNGVGSLLKARMPGWRPLVSGCDTGLSDAGVVALPVDVPQDGQYRLWSRVSPPKPAKGAAGTGVSLLQVDDGCPVPAWGSSAPKGVWSWQSGPDLTLTAGRHTLRFLGGAGGVDLDRALLTADPACVPVAPAGICPAAR